jgi:hypothetical protein
MTEEQLRLLIAYIDAAAEGAQNRLHSQVRLANTKARLKEKLIESIQTKKEQ